MIKTVEPRKVFINVLKEVSSLISVPEDKLQAELDQSNLSKKSKYWLLRIVNEELTRFNTNGSLGQEYEISKDIKNSVLEISDKQNCTFEELVNGLEKLANSDISTSKEEKENQPVSNIKTIKFISPELQEFLRNYRIKNKLSQKEMAAFLKISLNRYSTLLSGSLRITPALEDNLRVYFYKDYQYQITTALNTCIVLPCKNNFSLLIYYISYSEDITYEEIAKKFNISYYSLIGLVRSKDFLTKKTAIALKEQILNSHNLTEDILNLCNEVLFCTLIHVYRVNQALSLSDFAKQLNISYELLFKIEKTVNSVPTEVKKKFVEIIVSSYGSEFALKFDDITIKKSERKTIVLSENSFEKIEELGRKRKSLRKRPFSHNRKIIELGYKYNFDFRAVQEEPKYKYISPELRNFLLDYAKILNSKSISSISKSLHITGNTLSRIMSGNLDITPNIEQKLTGSISKEFYSDLKIYLQNCIRLPIVNIFKVLVLSYIANNNLSFTLLSYKLEISQGALYQLTSSRDYISIEIIQKLKTLIDNNPKSNDKSKDLCDEVLFCALIHDFRIKQKLSIEEFASQLNITYKELLMIEKTIIATPSNVKDKFSEIVSSYGKNKKLTLKFGKDFASNFADLTVKKTKHKPAGSK